VVEKVAKSRQQLEKDKKKIKEESKRGKKKRPR